MGLLDSKHEMTYMNGLVDLQDLHKLIDEKLGGKYMVKFLKKGNAGQQMLGGEKFDQILIAKNAYHRTLISVDQLPKQVGQEKDETYIHFNRATLKGWLQFLYDNTGFIGGGIINMCYGNNKEFDDDILKALQTKYEIKKREMNTGISALWKKDYVKEVE